VPWAPLVSALVLIAAGPALVGYLGQVAPRLLKKPLAEFPLTVEGYQGRASTMDPLIWDRVGGQSYVIIDYQRPGMPPIDFYAAYYEYQRKAGDFIHSPKLCLPGAGWFIEHAIARNIDLARTVPSLGDRLTFNEMLIHKDGARQLVYYWYQGRDRNFTSEYLAKFYMVLDGIFRRRTDGALVRLVMPLTGLDESRGREVLDQFARFVSSRLTEHLP
jgi:EpsI family protein